MASAVTTLEELTTCPVCFELYNNPKSLSCLHVLCVNCVTKLSNNNQIECPECRTITETSSVKNDFNKQTLIDLYLKQKADIEIETEKAELYEEQTGILTCENCKKTKEVEWKCLECDIFMCPDCEQAHHNFPATEKHKVIPIKQVTESIKESIKETVEKLHQNCDLWKRKSEKHELVLKDVEEKTLSTVTTINQLATKLKHSIDDHHNSQLSKFDFNMTEISAKVSEKKCLIDTYTKDLKNKAMLLSDIIEKNNTVTLVKQSQKLQSEILSALKDIKLEVENIKEPAISSINIKEPEPWDSSKGTEVYVTLQSNVEEIQLVKEMTDEDFVVCQHQSSENIDKVGYLKIFDGERKLKRLQTLDLGYVPLRLNAIGSTLWCTGQDGLHIYDKNLNFIIALKEDRVKDPTCIIKDINGNIMAATNWKLHHLDSAGKYLGELALGKFMDIAIRDRTMYALDCRKQKILIFQYKEDKCWFMPTSNMKWIHTKTIYLERTKQTLAENKNRQIHNITVSNDTIYASSWEGSDHCLYKICKSTSHDVLVQLPGNKVDGILWQPKLCGSDEYGNVLVADGRSSFLQVCSVNGKWSKVMLEGNESQLEDAVVDDRGQFIWTITKDCKLVKYSNK